MFYNIKLKISALFGIALQVLCLADISDENFKKYLNFIKLQPEQCHKHLNIDFSKTLHGGHF